jgi:hypothetical protein
MGHCETKIAVAIIIVFVILILQFMLHRAIYEHCFHTSILKECMMNRHIETHLRNNFCLFLLYLRTRYDHVNRRSYYNRKALSIFPSSQ